MTLVWTVVSIFLIFEVIVLFLLLLPLPFRGNELLGNLLHQVFSKLRIVVAFIFLFITFCVLESFWTTYKYSQKSTENLTKENYAHHFSSKFRAERNLYLSTFTLVVFLVIMLVEPFVTERNKKKIIVTTATNQNVSDIARNAATRTEQNVQTVEVKDEKKHL
eukprot:TRINITY_DN9848_c0_g1_i1.p1 TRINITY_DN9848_c0_g1~~TRINITY_DN9848_c0_g1_i1.p1  ORF type:complete len:163 (-),score=22.30 TRINITY_DN9848_c0_g1_i1:96-584(-)